jgi:hypothetical protein
LLRRRQQAHADAAAHDDRRERRHRDPAGRARPRPRGHAGHRDRVRRVLLLAVAHGPGAGGAHAPGHPFRQRSKAGARRGLEPPAAVLLVLPGAEGEARRDRAGAARGPARDGRALRPPAGPRRAPLRRRPRHVPGGGRRASCWKGATPARAGASASTPNAS